MRTGSVADAFVMKWMGAIDQVPCSTIVVIWILYLLTDHTINIFCLPSHRGEERSQAYRHSSAALSGYLLQENTKGISIQPAFPSFESMSSTRRKNRAPCPWESFLVRIYKTKKGVSTINLESKWNILQSLFNTVSRFITHSYLWYALYSSAE